MVVNGRVLWIFFCLAFSQIWFATGDDGRHHMMGISWFVTAMFFIWFWMFRKP